MSFPSPEILAMPDGEVLFYPSLFTTAESADLFQQLSATIQWEQRHINLPVGKVPLPRLTAWYGDAGTAYSYSGMTFYPHEWTPQLLQIKKQVERIAGVQFNSVLLNLYRHEQDSVSWHSDDEPELGENPVIASVSLGSVRPFQFKHKQNSHLKLSINLTPGSLLLMGGTTQHYWKHQLPKVKESCGARMNLTFRVIT